MKIAFKTDIICDMIKKAASIKPKLTIGIISLYRLKQTMELLECISESIINGLDYEIIILDNNSDNETKTALMTYAKERDNITLIFSPFNLRVARSRNLFAEVAEGDYVMFLDNDLKITPNFIMNMYESVAYRYCINFSKIIEKNRVMTIGRNIINNRMDCTNDRLALSNPLTWRIRKVDIGPGGSTIFPASLFKKIKYDSSLFDHEDWDYCINLKKNYPGVPVLYNPMATAIHYPTHDLSGEYGKIRRDNEARDSARQIIFDKWGVEC